VHFRTASGIFVEWLIKNGRLLRLRKIYNIAASSPLRAMIARFQSSRIAKWQG